MSQHDTLVRVRCTNAQPDLFTNTICGWTGRRVGRRLEVGKRVVQLSPTHERCPRCGGRVELIQLERPGGRP